MHKRLNADRDAERRGSYGATDRRVFEGERRNRICRRGPGRDLPVDGAIAGCTGVCEQGEEGAGRDPEVCKQGNGPEPAADHEVDSKLPGDGDYRAEAEPKTAISGQVHRPGCAIACRGGHCTRAAERSGDEVHSEAGAQGVRQSRVCAAIGNLGVAYLQPARQHEVSAGGGKLRANAPESGIDRRAAEAGAAGSARLSANRHRTAGRLGRRKRCLPHQRGGMR